MNISGTFHTKTIMPYWNEMKETIKLSSLGLWVQRHYKQGFCLSNLGSSLKCLPSLRSMGNPSFSHWPIILCLTFAKPWGASNSRPSCLHYWSTQMLGLQVWAARPGENLFLTFCDKDCLRTVLPVTMIQTSNTQKHWFGNLEEKSFELYL